MESDFIGLAGGVNTYAYADGNSISRIDPTGRFSISPSMARALARAGLAEAAGLGPENPAADVVAFVALVTTLASTPDGDQASSCPKKKKCKEVTEQNIRAELALSRMRTLQPSITMDVVQKYVEAIEAGAQPDPIKVDEDVIVDGNHRYVASLLCKIPPLVQPWTRPLSVPPIPIQNLRIDP